jgi:hypothetical protein
MDWEHFDCYMVAFDNRRQFIDEDNEEVKAIFYDYNTGRAIVHYHDGRIFVIHDPSEVRGRDVTAFNYSEGNAFFKME